MNIETKEQKDTPPKTIEQLKGEAYDLIFQKERLEMAHAEILKQLQAKNVEIAAKQEFDTEEG